MYILVSNSKKCLYYAMIHVQLPKKVYIIEMCFSQCLGYIYTVRNRMYNTYLNQLKIKKEENKTKFLK